MLPLKPWPRRNVARACFCLRRSFICPALPQKPFRGHTTQRPFGLENLTLFCSWTILAATGGSLNPSCLGQRRASIRVGLALRRRTPHTVCVGDALAETVGENEPLFLSVRVPSPAQLYGRFPSPHAKVFRNSGKSPFPNSLSWSSVASSRSGQAQGIVHFFPICQLGTAGRHPRL
jgi:hypothetical protein